MNVGYKFIYKDGFPTIKSNLIGNELDMLEAVQITHNDYFNRNIRYTYDPRAGDNGETSEFYNSNSYTTGILTAAGVTDIADPSWHFHPGFDKPLPIKSTFGDSK